MGTRRVDDMDDNLLDGTDLTWLAGLAQALLGERAAAEDLAQDAALAALVGPMPPGVPRRAWLRAVAQRLAARRFRGDGRRAWREKEVARPEAMPDSAELVERAEVAEQVTGAARRLPEPYRRAILLRFLEGRSTEEIAKEEGSPADTVRWRVRRGLEMLRTDLMREHDRDWSSWSVLLMPLARLRGDAGLAAAGAPGVSAGTVASMMAMKATMAVAAVLGCVGIWLAWGTEESTPELGLTAGDVEVAQRPDRGKPVDEVSIPGVAPAGERLTLADEADASEAPAESNQGTGDLWGRVVDEQGAAVAGATVYVFPALTGDREEQKLGPVVARTSSDWQGAFRIAAAEIESGAFGERGLDLGAVANGYLRRVVPKVLDAQDEDGLVVVLEAGRVLAGRVVDLDGAPVADLELLTYSAYGGISHVSPSQMRMRAERAVLGGAGYGQCLARTDGRGEVRFSGLPGGDLAVLSLDPGWSIVESRRVSEQDLSVVWTAQRQLGVRVVVIDASTGQPVERASGTFGLEVTFANGEEDDFSQWVGRGKGEVSMVLGPELMPGLEERVITRVVFYGTARSGDGPAVDWRAEPIEDVGGATGVAEVRVEVEPEVPLVAAADVAQNEDESGQTATIEFDVRYGDAAPFEGELDVGWRVQGDSKSEDSARAKKAGVGRYRVEVPAGDLSLEVADRYSSGSLPPWTGDLRCIAEQKTLAYVTLPRGCSAAVTRPDGWRGEWFLRASWRPPGAEEWRGSWGYSTDEASLRLSVLRPAEWRFELRRDTALERDPIVRTVSLIEGDSAIVD